jgi:hypothetical protein
MKKQDDKLPQKPKLRINLDPRDYMGALDQLVISLPIRRKSHHLSLTAEAVDVA